jgi:hypothetical protein
MMTNLLSLCIQRLLSPRSKIPRSTLLTRPSRNSCPDLRPIGALRFFGACLFVIFSMDLLRSSMSLHGKQYLRTIRRYCDGVLVRKRIVCRFPEERAGDSITQKQFVVAFAASSVLAVIA